VPEVDGYRLLVSRSPGFQGVLIDQRLAGTKLRLRQLHDRTVLLAGERLRAGAEGPPSAPRAVFVSTIQQAPGLQIEFPPDVVNGEACMIRGTTVPGTRIVVAGQDVAAIRQGTSRRPWREARIQCDRRGSHRSRRQHHLQIEGRGSQVLAGGR